MDIAVGRLIDNDHIPVAVFQTFRGYPDDGSTANPWLQIKRSIVCQNEQPLSLLRNVDKMITFEHVADPQICHNLLAFRYLCCRGLYPHLMGGNRIWWQRGCQEQQ